METGLRRGIARNQENPLATLVIIMNQFSLSNMDYNFCQFLFQAFGLHYPEALSHILLVDAGWLFSTCWSILKGWIDLRTASKIKFITMSELTDYIAEENLPKDYGGTNWQYTYTRMTPK